MVKCITCDKEYSSKCNLQQNHYKKYPSHTPDDWEKCPECENCYENLGHHWAHNPQHTPKLTKEQKEIITGVLMSDGNIEGSGRSSLLRISSITKEYLEYLDEKLGVLSTGVNFHRTAEKSAEANRKHGFDESAKADNYSDIYRLNTRKIPELNEFREWYASGRKVWPENIQMTPKILKHLYVCDGSIKRREDVRPIIIIGASNECENTDKIAGYFEDMYVNPSFYKGEYSDGTKSLNIAFGVDDSDWLWEYMGDPLPGFEYKWPEGYHST